MESALNGVQYIGEELECFVDNSDHSKALHVLFENTVAMPLCGWGVILFQNFGANQKCLFKITVTIVSVGGLVLAFNVF